MIRLTNGYAIEADSYCYTLGLAKTTKVVNKKTGEEEDKEILTECKYYPDLDKALLGYWKLMRRKGLSSFEGTLQAALDTIKKQDEKVRKLIDKVKEGN